MAQLSIQQAFALAMQHHQAGRLQEAENLYRQILAQQPQHPDALHSLGLLKHQMGRIDQAVDLMRQAIVLRSNWPEAQSDLGNALRDSRKLDEAIAAYRQAIALRPGYAEAHINLANALRDGGELEQAIAEYRCSIALDPNIPQAYNNLGVALKERGQLDDAIAAFRQAITLRPGYARAYSSLGNALRSKGQLDDAIAACRHSIFLDPNVAEFYTNLGHACKAHGKLGDAIAAFRKSIVLNPRLPASHVNLGNALRVNGQLEEAVAVLRHSVALAPSLAEAHSNLGNALRDLGQLDGAIAAYRQALALDPTLAKTHNNLVYAMQFDPACDRDCIAAEQRRWNEQHAAPLLAEIRPFLNDPSPGRRLKAGYVSPDFFTQAEAHFVAPLLGAHDHDQFEIHCYSSVARPDLTTARLRANADVWHDVLGESDAQLADRIRSDRIDVLIDLTMHMANNRLLTFARKPAPVQVAWLAYPGSTGLGTMDYRLTDSFMDGPEKGELPLFEKPVRLPDCWCCYDPLCQPLASKPPPVSDLGHITFGSLNNFCKLNPWVLSLWARVLRAVPHSHLLLRAAEGEQRRQTAEFLKGQGIAAERLEFEASCPRMQYLRLYDRIDIALDPFPYNGITTTCDALWMGVPVITLAGETAASRAGLGLLSTAGLPEMVGQTAEQFTQIAVALAGDVPRLQQLRSTLRQRMEQSPLMDAPRFARNIEAAYRRMWHTWCEMVSG